MLDLSRVSREKTLEDSEVEGLVHRSREGDLDAFNDLVDRFHREVYRVAFRMLCNPEASEDATQEIFLKAWSNLGRFQRKAKFSTWLHAIAVNHCLNVIRRRTREKAFEEKPGNADAIDIEEALALPCPHSPPDWALQITLREAIGRLPEKQGVVLTMHYYVGYSVKEIAAALNLPPTTVYSRLDHAILRLRREIHPKEE